jgi:hypothetical protein
MTRERVEQAGKKIASGEGGNRPSTCHRPLTEHPGALAVAFIAILLRSEVAKNGVAMTNVLNLNQTDQRTRWWSPCAWKSLP